MHVPTGTITPLHSEVDELQQALHGLRDKLGYEPDPDDVVIIRGTPQAVQRTSDRVCLGSAERARRNARRKAQTKARRAGR